MTDFDPTKLGAKPTNNEFDPLALGAKPVSTDPEASRSAKALGTVSKFSDIAGYVATALGALGLKRQSKKADKESQEAFRKASELTKKARNTTDPVEKSRLLGEARAIMTTSGEKVANINQEIVDYKTSTNITDADMERSNFDFALRRGGAAALEAGSMMVPGAATAAQTAGGRIAQAAIKGATSSGLSSAGSSLLDAETTQEFMSDTAVGAIMGAVTSAAFTGLSEGREAWKAKKLAKQRNKWVKPTGELNIEDSDISDFIATNNSKKSFKNIDQKHYSPQEKVDSFKRNGLARNDLMNEATDAYGNKYSIGEKVLDDKTDGLFKNKIMPILEGSDTKITKSSILATLEANKAGSLNPEVEETAIKWVKENLDDVMSAGDAYKWKQQLMSGSFNRSGSPKISLNGQSSRSTGWAILGQIKENLSPEDSTLLQNALDEVTEAYAWKDLVTSAAKKYQREAMKGKFLVDGKKIATKAAGAGAVALGTASWNPLLALGLLGSQVSNISQEFATQPLQKFGQNVVEKEAGKQLPNVITSLVGKIPQATK